MFDGEGKHSNASVKEGGAEHLKEGAGLAINASASFIYAADPASGPVVAFGPSQPTTPKVEGESFSEVGSDHASIEAKINPRSETRRPRHRIPIYWGRCATETTCAQSPYETNAPEPDGHISADFDVHEVAVKLKGLQPASTYHFRVIAKNSHGQATPGEDVSFKTEGAGGELTLPDDRGWELASPPDKQGAQIEPISRIGRRAGRGLRPPGHQLPGKRADRIKPRRQLEPRAGALPS